MTPTEDPTERAMHACIDLVNDFQHAIADAESVSRAIQIKERISACLGWLSEAENAALRKMDQL